MIMCYEIFVSSLPAAAEEVTARLARVSELEGMYGQIKTLLDDIGFLNRENPDYWMLHLRRFFNRAGILSREVKIVRGVCRQLQWHANHKKLDFTGSSHRDCTYRKDFLIIITTKCFWRF